ncbi:phosphoadenosine phosphosulfate reductase [Neiella marina]|uniref:Phosphoadenosine 5'-phosphosulfate reductase n=2 Tax=Neiella marina TaxID=508461 RepID=A0A8J2U5Q1_9GAMM|nr:phosphoadenylyl-sulfate reductase [Neiella marina]GGA80461.1 phosphoadenosine phosphosulfate reductase [Neiella marina]
MLAQSQLKSLSTLSPAAQRSELAAINGHLESLSAQERVAWGLEHLPGTQVLSSSFGIQSAVLLHMLVEQQPDIPVILVDTGYLFTETYQFIDQLQQRLNLNLKIYRNPISPVWQEARYGRLWEEGVEGIDKYNRMNKVEPMQRALEELNVGTWYSGLRRSQSSTRSELPVVDTVKGRFKMLPIIDWSNKDVHYYLKEYGLPYHPLWDKGYVSVGDAHTSRPLEVGMTEEETRFFGLKRECGLHESNVDGDGI